MNRLTIISLFTVFVLSNGCTKDPSPGTAAPLANFSGYTPTDNTGNITGDPDPTDWKTNDVFSGSIAARVETPDEKFDYTSLGAAPKMSGCIAYPNPAVNEFQLSFNLTEPAIMNIWITDSAQINTGFITAHYSTGNNNVNFNLNGYPSGKLVRVHYAGFNNKKQVCFRGHGDVMKGM